MTDEPRSDLRRDIELLDAGALEVIQRLLAGGAVPGDSVEHAMCRLAADRALAVFETLRGLVLRPAAPADHPAPGDGRAPLRAVA